MISCVCIEHMESIPDSSHCIKILLVSRKTSVLTSLLPVLHLQNHIACQTHSRISRIEGLIASENLDAFDIIHYDGGLDFTRDSRFAKRWKAMGKSIVTCYYGSDLRARGIIREMDEMSDLKLTSEFDHLAMKDDLEYVFYPYDPIE